MMKMNTLPEHVVIITHDIDIDLDDKYGKHLSAVHVADSDRYDKFTFDLSVIDDLSKYDIDLGEPWTFSEANDAARERIHASIQRFLAK